MDQYNWIWLQCQCFMTATRNVSIILFVVIFTNKCNVLCPNKWYVLFWFDDLLFVLLCCTWHNDSTKITYVNNISKIIIVFWLTNSCSFRSFLCCFFHYTRIFFEHLYLFFVSNAFNKISKNYSFWKFHRIGRIYWMSACLIYFFNYFLFHFSL